MDTGFLPYSRASFSFDIIFVALLLVLPALIFSIGRVRKKRQYQLHKILQTATGVALLVVIVLFEWDIRSHGWRQLAEPSPFYPMGVNVALWVHVFFSLPTTVLWIVTLTGAWRHFPKPAMPGSYSAAHKKWGRWTFYMMMGTSITGWIFYAVAFIA